jgi:hypothetical protein
VEVKLKCSSLWGESWHPENVLDEEDEHWGSEKEVESWIEIHFLQMEIDVSSYRLKLPLFLAVDLLDLSWKGQTMILIGQTWTAESMLFKIPANAFLIVKREEKSHI